MVDSILHQPSQIRAIETRYKGYRFRSRLEARWAIYFDALEVAWEYEPEGFVLPNGDWYLPDFWLPFEPWGDYEVAGLWLEIKPKPLNEDEISRLEMLATSTGHHAFALVGSPGKHYVHKFSHSGGNSIVTARDMFYRVDFPIPHEIYLRYPFPLNHAFRKAVVAARSARFEHGARG